MKTFEEVMTTRTIKVSDQLYEYLLATSLREPNILKRLREETAQLPESSMQISPEQGQFMALLVRLMKARKTLEVGVFTGYSSLVVALALPPDGKVIACDVNEEYTSVARRYWKEAGIDHKVDLRIGPAVETLDQLINSGEKETFDFAFIDADKVRYDLYYERALKLVRSGGLIAIDNVFRRGRVADQSVTDPDTQATRLLNAKLLHDDRVYISMIPIADGLTLALKR